MGATTFAFRLDEASLRRALQEIEHKQQLYPDQHFGLDVSIELLPDGFGYEARNLQVKVVSETETDCLTRMVPAMKQEGSLN